MWHRRKLTLADGEYILWHVREWLLANGDKAVIICEPAKPCEFCQAICTCVNLISQIQKEQAA